MHAVVSRLIVLTGFIISITSQLTAQSVSINGDGSPPHPSAILDVKSDSMGLLIPRICIVVRASVGCRILAFGTHWTSWRETDV